MAIGLKISIHDSRTGTTEERVLAQFPVRIGRNPLNDLKLLPGFVSQFHAVVELHGDVLMLRDLGSKNGTMLPSGRAPAHQLVELAPSDGQFAISALSFRATVEDIGDVVPARAAQRGLLLGGLNAAAESLTETMLVGAESPVNFAAVMRAVAPEPARAPAVPRPVQVDQGTPGLRALQNLYANSRATVVRVLQTLSSDAMSLSHEDKQSLFEWATQTFPGLSEEAEFRRLVEFHGVVVDKADAAGQARRLEYVALQAVRELASLYGPRNAPIGTEEELVRFLTKVRDTLDMFFKCFIPLRDGYRQFKTDMDIRKATPYFDSPAGRAAIAVERTRTPSALAELLLNWSDDHTTAHKAVEGAFADLMIHQLALLSGVMRGVRALVQELAPPTVESVLVELRKKGQTGLMFGPYRFRELWKVYVSRHADLSESEKQLYSLVFGNDFVQAYAQLSGEAAAQVTTSDAEAGS